MTKTAKLSLRLAAAFMAACLLAVPAAAAGDPIVVIVNGSNPLENLSMAELRKIFLSDRSRWDTGKSVAPVIVAAGAAERAAFLKIVCGMNDSDFNKYFVQAAFTGKDVTPPKEVGSGREVKANVAASPRRYRLHQSYGVSWRRQ